MTTRTDNKIYNSFEEIEYDLNVKKLERQIAYEELLGVKNEFKESLQPIGWVQSALKFAGKYGLLVLFKKLFIR
ncbi:DUF6327 family protein [Changchengzhania lutea]|uniref:DUF6327 family protein n=1 Tax=Changchengzhania lutea TaxID=2049305 RepID=UPI00115F0E3E|nr:DUF6327 family protein [Changchengzhania lutea]